MFELNVRVCRMFYKKTVCAVVRVALTAGFAP